MPTASGGRRMHRRAGYEDYRIFESKQPNRCRVCGSELDKGVYVLGKPLDGRWDIVCVPCGSGVVDAARGRARPIVTRPGASARPAPTAASGRGSASADGMQWSRLVRYLRLCVERESALEPIRLNDRNRWKVLPLRQESVLCGSDPTVPLLPQIQELIADLGEMEAVFYGWPTVVVTDERDRPFVAPLFYRRLEPAGQAAGAIPLSELLPQVNMGLISSKWFSPDLVAAAVQNLAIGAAGFGQPAALTATALRLLTTLGIPLSQLDPGALLNALLLEDPWRPQELGVFNLVMAGRAVFDDDAKRSLIQDLEWMERATDWRGGAARLLFEGIDAPLVSLPDTSAIELNDSQERAQAAVSRAPLTVVTGPPGTGKSQTVVGIVAAAWMRGETVLLASTNNAPIDSVVEDKMAAIDPALMLRTGNGKVRTQLAAKLRDFVGEIQQRPDPGAPPLAPRTFAYHQAARELGERARAEGDVLIMAERRDRARAVVWGRASVPSDVARDRLGAELGRHCVRAGDGYGAGAHEPV
jgi:AAA domain